MIITNPSKHPARESQSLEYKHTTNCPRKGGLKSLATLICVVRAGVQSVGVMHKMASRLLVRESPVRLSMMRLEEKDMGLAQVDIV